MATNTKRIKVRKVHPKKKTSTELLRRRIDWSEAEWTIKEAKEDSENFHILQEILYKQCDDLDGSSIMTVARKLLLLDLVLGYETEGYTQEATSQLVSVIGDVLRDCADTLARRVGIAGTGKIENVIYGR